MDSPNVPRSEEHTSELQSQSNLLLPLLFFKWPGAHQVLPSSPTRRSSDLKNAGLHETAAHFRNAAPFLWTHQMFRDRKSTRLNSSHSQISYYLFFFLNGRAPTKFSPLPLHDALPISRMRDSMKRQPISGMRRLSYGLTKCS